MKYISVKPYEMHYTNASVLRDQINDFAPSKDVLNDARVCPNSSLWKIYG